MEKAKTIVTLISVILTAVGFSQNQAMLDACSILGIIMIVFSFLFFKKRKSNYFDIFLVSGIILITTSILGSIIFYQQQKRVQLWEQYVSSQNNQDIDELQQKADAGDGPAQYDLSTRFFEKGDYKNARFYAQKAADNGNPYGYVLLARMYQHGLGCKTDHHQAINNMKKAMYTGSIVFDDIVNGKIPLSRTDSIAIENCVQDDSTLRTILEKIKSEYEQEAPLHSRERLCDVMTPYYNEILDLSTKGFIPATEALYVFESYKNINGSYELKRLTNMLYQANHIPTGHSERYYFFQYLVYPDTLKNQFINTNKNLYLSLTPELRSFFIKDSCDKYSNRQLISEYQLYRAQYNWCKDLAKNPKKRIDYFVSTHNDYQADFTYAKYFLERIILGIQDRMNHLDEYDGDTLVQKY